MPTPHIIIEPRVGGGPVVELTPCAGVTIIMTMSNAVRVFDTGSRRGLAIPGAANGTSLTIHSDDGTLEYNSPTAEYSLILPRGLADDLYAAFGEAEVGEPLKEGIDLKAVVEGDPGTLEGGRKRRLSVKKQARRTQRKRRNPVGK